jgi:hypothetical protein
MLSTVVHPSPGNSFPLIILCIPWPYTISSHRKVKVCLTVSRTPDAILITIFPRESQLVRAEHASRIKKPPCLQMTRPRLLIDSQAKHTVLIHSKALDTAGRIKAIYRPVSPNRARPNESHQSPRHRRPLTNKKKHPTDGTG